MSYLADTLMMESGLFWCVFEAIDARAGRVVRAFFGDDAEQRARAYARVLNGR